MAGQVRDRHFIGRIGVRLWGPFIFGALVSLAVVAAAVWISADAQRDQAATVQREVAERVVSQLQQYVREFRDDVTSLVDVLPLADMDEDAQRSLLKSVTSNPNSPIFQVSIVGLDGVERVKAIQHRPRPTNFEALNGDPAFEAARGGRVYFGPVYISEFNLPALNMALPIKDTMGDVTAVLRAEIDLSTMWSLVNAASAGERGYVYVVDADGNLLAYRDVQRIKDNPRVADLPVVAEAAKAESLLPAAREYATGLEGVPVLAFYQPVDIAVRRPEAEDGRWIVVVEQPLSDAYAQANSLGLIGLGLAVAALAAISLVGLYIRQRIARPIEALRAGAAALARGDLNYRIHVDTGDELQFLAEEFNDMSATLQQSQARLAALARERGRQAEDAQARLREMTALIQSGRAITSLDLKDVLGRLAYEAARAVEGDRCSIYVLDSKQRRLVLRGEWDASLSGPGRAGGNGQASADLRPGRLESIAFEWGEGIVGWIAREDRSIFLANAQADKRFTAKASNDHEIAALIGVPVRLDDTIVAVLQATTRPGTPAFDPSDQRLLTTFASQAAAAIKNSYLYETERRRAQEMAIVAEIIRTISSSLDLDATLNAILSSVRRLIAYDLAEITLWDPEAEVLRTRGRGADPRYDEYSRTAGGVYRLGQGITGWIASHRAPLLVSDIATGEVAPAVDLDQFPIRSVVGVPLMSAQPTDGMRPQLIGTLELAAYTPGAFNESHLDTLRTIAAQAAVAIQNAQLYLESRRRAVESAGLFRVASIAASALEPDEILRRIMAEAAGLLGAQRGVVLLHNPETQLLEAHPTALFGMPYERLLDLKLDAGAAALERSVFRTGRVLRLGDLAADLDGLDYYQPVVERFQARYMLSAPLAVRDQRIGEVHIIRTAGAPFDLDDERRLLTLARLLSGVIENARLYALMDMRLKQRVDELAALSTISQELNATLELERILGLVLDEAVRAASAAHGAIVLVQPATQQLVVRAMLGYSAEEVERAKTMRLQAGKGIVGKVIETGEPLRVDDVHVPPTDGDNLENADYIQIAAETRSDLCVPIRYALEVVGAINLESPLLAHFTQDHVTFLNALAAQAAIAIGNAQRFEEQLRRGELLRHRAEQLANLFEIGQAFRSDRPLVDVLDDVVHAVQQTAGFSVVLLSVLQSDPPVLERVAAAGLPVARVEEMKKVRTPWETVKVVMHDAFRISQSFYIPAEHNVVTSELDTWPPFKASVTPRASGRWHEQDLLVTPLRGSGDRILGIMSVDEPFDGRIPDRAVIETLELFANQAAIAIENARLLEDLQQRIDSLMLFNQVSRTISARLDLDGLLATLVDASIDLIGCQRAAIFLRDSATGRLVPRKARGFELDQIAHQSWAEGEGLVGAVARDGRALIVPDLKTPDSIFGGDSAAMMLVPIAEGGQVIGVLGVDQSTPPSGDLPSGGLRPRPRAFSNTDLLLLSTLADQAAVAIQNTQLLAETQRRLLEQSVLYESSQALALARDERGAIAAATERMVSHLGATALCYYSYDEANGTIRTDYEYWTPQATARERRSALREVLKLEPDYPHLATALRTRTPQTLKRSDPSLSPAERDMLIAYDGQTVIAVPMAARDRVLGYFEVWDSQRERDYDQADERLMLALASQAGVAVENARLFGQTVARTRELSTLFEATTAITTSLALDRVLDAVGQQIARALDVHTVTVTRWDRVHNQVVVMTDRDVHNAGRVDAPGTVYSLDTYPGAVHMLEDARTYALRQSDEALDELDRVNLQRLGLKALLRLPLVAQDRIIGMVELGERQRDRAFSADEIQLAQTLTSQAAIAITNAELFAETQRRVAELQTINAVSQVITATMPLSQLVELIRREVGRVIDTSSFYIALYDVAADSITFPIFYDRGKPISVEPTPGEAGVTGYIFNTRKPLLINTPADLEALGIEPRGSPHLGVGLGAGCQSYVGVPTMIGDFVSGVMAVQDYDHPYAYDEGHVRILSTIAAQAAVVIENARLFEETQRRLHEQGLFYEAGRAISASLEYHAVLETAADQLLRVTGVQGAILSEWDRDSDRLTIVFEKYQDTSASSRLTAGIGSSDASGRVLPKDAVRRPFDSPFGSAQGKAEGRLEAGDDLVYPLADYPNIQQALRDREALLIRRDDPALDPHERAALERTGFFYALTMPMIARDQVIGAVWLVDARMDRAFSEVDQRLIATLVNQIAAAVTNARLFDQVRRFTQELEERVRQRTDELAMANTQLTLERDRVETLYRITSELSASLDLDRVLNRALALVNDAVGTTRSSILMVDSERGILLHRAALGRGESLPPGGRATRFQGDQGLAGWVIQNRLPAIVPDIRADDRWEATSSYQQTGATSSHSQTGTTPDYDENAYRSALAVPLVVGDDALGALLLLHADEDYFAESHLRLVEAAASQVATAINNAALFGLIRESAERLGAMLRDKQIEAAKAQAILESVADGVLVTDAADTIILFNAAAERILGRARQSVLNRPTADIIGLYGLKPGLSGVEGSPDGGLKSLDGGTVGAHWEEQIARWRSEPESRRAVPSLSNRVHFEDEKRFVNVSIAPVTGPGEEFLGTVSVFRDITAEVEADLAKSEFVSTVSHELRTPMTSIKGYADLLLMGTAGLLNENQERFLNIIKTNADRLSVLVDDLLDISRIETGRTVLDIKQVSLVAVIEQVLTTLRERIEQKGLVIRVDVPPGDPLLVLGDNARLIQILTNLVGNAYQYTQSGGTITVRARATGDDMLRVDVHDTGIGIAPEDAPKVFDRFFRADHPTVQEFPGTGLGLSIVKYLVEMHGGEIWVDSAVGRGTTFSFTVRLVEARDAAGARPALTSSETLESAAAAPPSGEPSTPPSAAPSAPLRAGLRARPGADSGLRAVRTEPPRILVVEDDADIAALFARNLSQVGYAVQTVGTGRAAIESAKRERPDLITLDIYLPDIDGQDVLRTLKADPRTADVPVVVVTVVPDSTESLQLGAIDFLTKPIDSSALLGAVSRVLGQVGSVLVIEDDLDTCKLLTEALQRAGFRVQVTSNGRLALAQAKRERPDLVLLDLKLPRMDGYTILQHLKAMPSTANIPVIIMTGSVTIDAVKEQQFLALGASGFVAKPFDVEALIGQIESLLAPSHQQMP